MRPLLGLLLLARLAFGAGTAADLAQAIRESGLDADECYHVHDLTLVREDIRLYFTDGFLIFGKPVNNARIFAVFSTEGADTGDAEVLLMPPNRSERRSLASYTGSPNMDEHFRAAVMTFSGDMGRDLAEEIRANSFNRKSPEMGVLLSDRWNPVLHNIGASFETRLVLNLLSGAHGSGFLTAALSGKRLGNFDIIYDPRSSEQIVAGQVAFRDNRSYFDVWTSFKARSYRNRIHAVTPEFTLKDYRIDATLEPDLELRVTTRVKLTPTSAAEQVLPFDIAHQIKIISAQVDGQAAEVLQRESMRSDLIRNSGNELLLVVPPHPLVAGREYELEFQHIGKVIHNAGDRVYYVSARSNWYPTRGMQFATYDITFRYPKMLDLVTPGQVIEDKKEGEWRITRRRTAAAIRTAGFNLGTYERARVTRGGYTVEVCANRGVERALQPKPAPPVVIPTSPAWSRQGRRQEVVALPAPPPPDPTARLRTLASETAAALQFMAAHFGPPPLKTVTISPIPGAFGQGFAGLIYLSTLAYLGPNSRPIQSLNERQQLFLGDILQAHELAHQWWGNVVTAATYHDEWLMEALADYSALLYLEKRKGPHALESVLDAYRKNLLARTAEGKTVESAGPIVLGSRLVSSQVPEAWRTITYGKGSWILHMLRRRMGDEQFLAMLGQLRRQYEWRSISTEEFQELAAGFLPPKSPDPKLEEFFDQWVYGTGIPALKLTYSVKGRAPSVRLVGELTQSDVDGDFSVRVPVEIEFGHGKSITHWVSSSSDPVAFTVRLRRIPAKVLLDPTDCVLRR